MPKTKKTDQPTGKNSIYKRYTITLPENIRQIAEKIEKKERRSFSNLLAILIEKYAIESGVSKIVKNPQK